MFSQRVARVRHFPVPFLSVAGAGGAGGGAAVGAEVAAGVVEVSPAALFSSSVGSELLVSNVGLTGALSEERSGGTYPVSLQ